MNCRLLEGLSIRLSKGLSETVANISILNRWDSLTVMDLQVTVIGS